MQDWFLDAKLGIFIHWGIYAVLGVSESWSFYQGRISYEDYLEQSRGFTAANYDPQSWARLFKEAGAKYAVLTSKHHDGLALWDTEASDLNVVQRTPAGRDLIAPYTAALRKEGLRVGLYFSHSDWSHPDYATVWRPDERAKREEIEKNRFVHPSGPEDFAAWDRFLQFHRAQLKELLTRFGPLDLLWFDGDWERDVKQWRFQDLREWLDEVSPWTVLNSRIWGLGDYATPEQGLPVLPPQGPWEFCVTMNRSWGYQPRDTQYKSVPQLIWLFAETIGMGGNLLLGIGPQEDGTIPAEEVARLKGLGAWIRGNEEAIYATKAGLPRGHFYGPSTLSKDGKNLYLFQFNYPGTPFPLKGLQNRIQRISILKSGKPLAYQKIGGAPWLNIPGVVWISLPPKFCDPTATVIKIELEGPLDIYRGEGQALPAK